MSNSRWKSDGGHVFKKNAEVVCSVFQKARQAVQAGHAIQKIVNAASGSIKIRAAIHSEEAIIRGSDYSGRPVDLASRLLDFTRRGQILLSLVTRALVKDLLPAGFFLQDLGMHLLAGEHELTRVFHLIHPELPDTFAAIHTRGSFAELLPFQLTSFVGREHETNMIKEQLARSRLLTLTGAGGVGKTRLALKAGAELAREFPDGAWLADFTSLSFPDLVPQTVASTLGVREEANQSILETLIARLCPKKFLLILDNCEHLIQAVTELCDQLLSNCPDLRILATSRQPLGILNEMAWRVPSFAVPDPENILSIEELCQNDAAKLFLDRIPPSPLTFHLNSQNVLSVAKICRKLDGIPLAIELAAARVRDMSPEEILERLRDRFDVLASQGTVWLERHETLRNAIDWSYNLLSKEEQIFFRRVSVFSGRFSLEAALHVCSGYGLDAKDVPDLISRLADKSLVMMEERQAEAARYRLLETIRQYAAEQLQAFDEVEGIRERHLDFFLRFAEEAEPNLRGPNQVEWLNFLEMDHDNFRMALEWSKRTAEAVKKGLGIGIALRPFWFVRGYCSEGRNHLVSLLRVRTQANQRP